MCRSTSFSEWLREHRTAAKLSQRALAEEANIPQSTIAKWETGDRTPRRGQFEVIAEALGCSVLEVRDAVWGFSDCA